MRAVRKVAKGPGHIELCDIPEPDIEAPDQVKIAVQRGGLCGTDLHIKEGGYGANPPVTLCHEFSGEVIEIGSDVTRVQLGDRVTVMPTASEACGTCRYCQVGEYFFCPSRASLGSGRDGGFAEFCVAPENLIFPLPEHVSYDAAALVEPLACCVKAVHQKTQIAPGDVVLISGPGPIGLMCAWLARLSGARVVVAGTTADTDRLKTAKEQGASVTVDVSQESVVELVQELTEGQGADVVVDCGGSAGSVNQCLNAVRPLGSYTQVALIDHPIDVDFGRIIYKQLRVQGAIAQNWSAWRRTLDLVQTGAVDLTQFVSHRLPLEDWEAAFEGAENKVGLKYLLCP